MTAPLFHLRDLVFGYGPGRPIVCGASLRLDAGERVALAGANGSGKTTLFHLMVGLLRPSAGTVEAFGVVCRDERDFQPVRARAGLLFQDSDDQLFCPTVLEDVAFGPLNLGHSSAGARAIAMETLETLGLSAIAGRVTHRLSGGEKRLVALATVLAMRPEVLLLDEPTNGLDTRAEARITAILEALPQSMVVISHDQAFLRRLATRRLRLVDGRLQDD
jgi:cobalt/nickel transport system ATP-binding protein